MPKEFNDCVKNGGKVTTVSGPSKDHGLKKDEYVHYCTINGKTYRGEVKKKKEGNSMNREQALKFISEQSWAILPSALEALISRIETIDFEKASLEDFDLSMGNYKLNGEEAIIEISGSMFKKPDIFSFLLGESTYEGIQASLEAALDDPKVKTILLDIDSPGGIVNGASNLVDFISQAKERKPIRVYSDGSLTSAAYWIASATNSISTSPTATVGSIGVVATHIDLSKLYENFGVKVSYITGGKYKAVGNSAEPLTEENKAYLENLVNQNYEVFYNSVANLRGLNLSGVSSWADGKVFRPEEAKSLGLIDQISNSLNSSGSSPSGGFTMEITREYLDNNQAKLVQEIKDEAIKDFQTKLDSIQTEKENLEAEKVQIEQERDKLKAKIPEDENANLSQEAKEKLEAYKARIESLETKNMENELKTLAGEEISSKLMGYKDKLSNEDLKVFATDFAKMQSIIDDLGSAKGTEKQSTADQNEEAEIAKIKEEQGLNWTDATVEYYKQKK